MKFSVLLVLLLQFVSGAVVRVADGTITGAAPSPLQRDSIFGNDTTLPSPDQLGRINFGFNSSGPYSLTGAIILLVSGAILVFWGYSSLDAMIFIIGFYVGAAVCLVVLNTLQANGTTHLGNKDMIYLIAIGISGVIFGSVFVWLKKVGIILTGAALGFFGGSALLQVQALSTVEIPGIGVQNTRIIILVAFAILGALLAWKLEAPVLILATSVLGSFAIFLGVDYWVQSGFGVWVYRAIDYRSFAPLTTNGYYMLGGFLAVALIGCLLQHSQAKKSGKLK
ncbi:hypothetical protein HDU91_002066 [Kappamyces sp. JEL0680]|nr:hypothetical protein HDU91_002066 [Kappamyces sp. JEL0680]